ncbi:hypothetical protein MASR1M48_16280 [Lactococcus petauri]
MKNILALTLCLFSISTFAIEDVYDRQVKPGMTVNFAGSTCPAGYLSTNGANVSRTTYSKLFAAIGTTYGTGDGSTTFGLPRVMPRYLGSISLVNCSFSTSSATFVDITPASCTQTAEGLISSPVDGKTFGGVIANLPKGYVKISFTGFVGLSQLTTYSAYISFHDGVNSSEYASFTNNGSGGVAYLGGGAIIGYIKYLTDSSNVYIRMRGKATSGFLLTVSSSPDAALNGKVSFEYFPFSGYPTDNCIKY